MSSVMLMLPLLVAAAPVMVEVAPSEHLAVIDQGPPGAPVVVLIPGLSGCNYGFRNLTPLLHDQGLRTISVEPLGLGLSDRTEDADYTLTAQAARIAAVLDDHEITGAMVVSQGVGTTMCLRLVLARPELVAGIVSIEGGAVESAATPTVRRSLNLAKLVARMGGTRFLRDRYGDDLRSASGDDSWVDRRTVGRYFRGPSRDIQGTLDAFLAMSEQKEPELLRPQLGEITVPVLLLWGDAEHEGGLGPKTRADLMDQLPNLKLQAVPGAGHFIYEEQPQVVADAVATLLAGIAVD